MPDSARLSTDWHQRKIRVWHSDQVTVRLKHKLPPAVPPCNATCAAVIAWPYRTLWRRGTALSALWEELTACCWRGTLRHVTQYLKKDTCANPSVIGFNFILGHFETCELLFILVKTKLTHLLKHLTCYFVNQDCVSKYSVCILVTTWLICYC